MDIWKDVPIFVALPLAVVAAVMSGGGGVQQEIASYLAEALKPQVADLGSDPGYLLGVATPWLPLPQDVTTIAPPALPISGPRRQI
jgi:hypothetical protein